MATAKTAGKAGKNEPKAPKAAVAAAPTASPPASPPADPPAATPAADAGNQAQDHEKGKWTPHEIVDGVAKPVGQFVPSVHRLERAQALPTLPEKMIGRPPHEGIQSFKDTDGRTMNVLVADGILYKQEV